MQIEVLADADAVAVAVAAPAAEIIAEQARTAVRERGRHCLAVRGGRTPWRMLRLLAAEDVPWAQVHLFQIDERVAPDGDGVRDLTHIAASLLRHVPLPAAQVHAMDVVSPDLGDAALRVADAEFALIAPCLGHRRMTLTYPALNRARCVLWLATEAEKRVARAPARPRHHDPRRLRRCAPRAGACRRGGGGVSADST